MNKIKSKSPIKIASYYYCHTCGTMLQGEDQNYCHMCGRKLKDDDTRRIKDSWRYKDKMWFRLDDDFTFSVDIPDLTVARVSESIWEYGKKNGWNEMIQAFEEKL